MKWKLLGALIDFFRVFIVITDVGICKLKIVPIYFIKLIILSFFLIVEFLKLCKNKSALFQKKLSVGNVVSKCTEFL